MRIFRPRFAVRAVRSILRDAPLAASVFVTNRCNFACTFCEYPTFNTVKKRELRPEDFGRLARKLADAGVVMVAVIGGEPLVRKDIVEVVAAMTPHLMVQITTNGWFVDAAKARALFAAGVYMINVSLDSASAESHDAGRGTSGAFERALGAVKVLRDAPKVGTDQTVGFESILSGRNWDEVEDMIRIAADLGVRIVFQPYSDGHVTAKLPEMSKVRGDATARFRALKARYPALYNSDAMIERFTPFFRDGRIAGCQAGRTYFNVDAYGQLTRCEEQRASYGRILEMNAWELDAALARVRADTRADGCDTCWLRTRGETEPLYDDGFDHYVSITKDMFGVGIPRALTLPLRSRRLKRLVRAGLDVAARFDRPPS